MANSSAAGGSEISIQMPAAAVDPFQPEKCLNRCVRVVAFGEWAGDAFGTMASLWATLVLLAGYRSLLANEDFWLATVIIFQQAFRIFSRSYKLDNQSLFGTTKAVRWGAGSSFSRMLAQPQEGNEVVLIMGLSITWVDRFFRTIIQMSVAVMNSSFVPLIAGTLKLVVLIAMSKLHIRGAPLLKNRPQGCRECLLWALLFTSLVLTFLPMAAYRHYGIKWSDISILAMIWAVLLLNLRPQWIVNIISPPCSGHVLLFSAKVISSVLLAWGNLDIVFAGKIFTILVLSLGSLQKRNPANSMFGRSTEVILHTLFLFNMVIPLPGIGVQLIAPVLSPAIAAIILGSALLIGNLQIPVAIVQVVLSSWRLYMLLAHRDYSHLPWNNSQNMVPAIAVCYLLAILQGTHYIMACIIELLSFFPRRSLVRHLGLRGQRGEKAVDQYYKHAYATRIEIGVFAKWDTIILSSFAIESLSSSSSEKQLAGSYILDSLLQKGNDNRYLRVTSSDKEVSTLIAMLGWTSEQDRDIRLFAARITTVLAGSLRIARIPGMLKLVSSLLDAKNQQDTSQNNASSGLNPSAQSRNESADDRSMHGEGDNGVECCWICQCWQRIKEKWSIQGEELLTLRDWVCRYWQQMKEKWSIQEEEPLTRQDSLPLLGMKILEMLARDPDNCAEIIKATDLIPRTIRLIAYNTDTENRNDEQVINSTLKFLRRLAITGGKIGAALRQELCESPFLLSNLVGILEDSRSSPQMWESVMDIIAKLALNYNGRKEIGRVQVIISKLMHAFIGRDGERYDNQSLRMSAGEALANLTMNNIANCLAILEESKYDFIKDITELLKADNDYICVVGTLLQNFCAHTGDKLCHPEGMKHLLSAMQVVSENIMTAEGKKLEILVGLASHIFYIFPRCFVQNLNSHNNKVGLVKKLVDTLNYNSKPNPEYPRMRRVIVYMATFTVKFCEGYDNLFEEKGIMEALSKVEKTTSKVEGYRVFLGDEGVVLECDIPLPNLVARAKVEIDSVLRARAHRRRIL